MEAADFGYWRYIGFTYGSKASDWKLFFVPDGVEYEYAGEFWIWVENPELFFVPGSFISFDSDGKQDARDQMLKSEYEFRDVRKRRGVAKRQRELDEMNEHSKSIGNTTSP